jgi:hypothetical protein
MFDAMIHSDLVAIYAFTGNFGRGLINKINVPMLDLQQHQQKYKLLNHVLTYQMSARSRTHVLQAEANHGQYIPESNCDNFLDTVG